MFTPSMGVALIALIAAVSGGAYAATAAKSSKTISACVHHSGGGLYVARKCASHDKRLKWNVTGPRGAQGPGAVEYTYNSTAPAATAQNTRLGPAGPFSELTGSCVVLTGGIVVVELGATNSKSVSIDLTRLETNLGTPVNPFFETLTQPPASSPAVLLGEANSANAGDGINHTSMIITSPSHGDLELFERASHANNTCHLSVFFTPAS